jgi:hypothetical protein
MQITVLPSDKPTVVNFKVLGIDENDYGRLEARLGFIAPKRAIFGRHEAMAPTAFVDDPELSAGDREKISDWAASGGTKLDRD